MFKKYSIIFLALALIFAWSMAEDGVKIQKAESAKKVERPSVQIVKEKVDVPSPLNQVGVQTTGNRLEVLPAAKFYTDSDPLAVDAFVDVIRYAYRPYEARFGFDGGDSIGVWFRPSTQCSLLSIIVDFGPDAVGKNFNMEIRNINPAYDGEYDFSKGTEGGATMAGFPQDWLGTEVLGTFEYNVAASGVEIEFDAASLFGLSDDARNIGLHDFAVAWYMEPEEFDATLYVIWSNAPDPFDHHGFKYYSTGHASLGGQPGWVARQNFSIWAKVLYYGDPPPAITAANDIADVYNSLNPGPYAAHLSATDQGTDVFTGYIRKAAIIMDDDADMFNAPNDTIWVYDQPAGTDASIDVTYNIPNPGIGNTVYYWWHVEDNGAENSGDPEAQTHVATSTKFHFTVREKNPDASILLVDDSGSQTSADLVPMANNYTEAMDAYGYVYDHWNMDESDSTTLEMLELYSTVIWFVGGGQGGLAAGLDLAGTQLAPYLDNGGNLFFNGSDYVGIVENLEVWTEWITPTNDFILNYLMVDEILDDANLTRLDGVGSADTLYSGIAGTVTEAVTEFEADHLDFGFTYDYSGQANPGGDAEVIIQVFDEEIGDWNETAGHMYDGNDFKMIYLPWSFEKIIDTEVRVHLLSIFLGEVFGENAAPLFSNLIGSTYGVAGDGPYPVTVDVEDNDGSVASVELGYSIDEGDWNWVAMSGDGTYTGAIPELTGEQTVVAYTVRATDDLGKTRYHTETRMFERTDFVVQNKILYCGDDPYDWYYAEAGAGMDTKVTGTLNDLGVNYDYWDVDGRGYMPPDYYTIISQYDAVIWCGFADWVLNTFPENTAENPFADYVKNGGKMLFSSEEMIGQSHFDDGSYTFGPGEAAYDVLNVEWIGYDWNYDTVGVVGETSLTTGMDEILHLEPHAFGYMGELVDAVYPWDDDTYFLDAWLAPAGYNNWYSDFGVPGMAFEHNGVIVVPFPIAVMDTVNRAKFLQNVIDGFAVSIDKDAIASDIPKAFALHNNYPNPFNPVTNIQFDLIKASDVKITVFNLLGEKVRTIADQNYRAGQHSVTWNGTNESGSLVSSGVYIYKIETPEFVASKKMVLMK